MKIALAQTNPTVGDIDGNTARIIHQIEAAQARGAQLVIFPELAVFGYPPKDLVLRSALVDRNTRAIDQIAAQCVDIAAIVGYVQPDASLEGKGVLNAAAVCLDGRVCCSYAKRLLPTYDVFDESRYFKPGSEVRICPLQLGGQQRRVGVTICEDLWNDRQFEGRRVYGLDPIEQTVQAGADIIINIGASPFAAGRQGDRESIFAQQARQHGVTLVSVNQVGGNDELVFDGAGVVLDPEGKVIARAKAFAEDLLVVDLADGGRNREEAYPDRTGSIREALVLGVRDYIQKCRFEEAVLGLSGGIDSSLTAALAVQAIGAQRVHGIAMPSRYSSAHSLEDARELCDNLGVSLTVIPIEPIHRAMEESVGPHFEHRPPDVTEENIQARIRGNILMALSNKFDRLLLTTGNKSELAMGYCTLYGDMCGGLAVLSDVPKTVVYELARRVNAASDRCLIPQRSIDKPPSAELREDQRDQDTLPPYEILDAILEHYIEHDRPVEEIVGAGFDRRTVEQVTRTVDRNEYKRKQAPVGLRVTSRAFGTGRRMPIAARFS